MDLTQILLNGLSPDENVRNAASAAVKEAEEKDLGQFTQLLMNEVSDESKPENVRQMAGLVLKNAFTGRSQEVQEKKSQQWHSMGDAAKIQVRTQIVNVLQSPNKFARDVASQVIAAVGAIELASQGWPELIPELSKVVSNANTESGFREASVQALGYLCDILDPHVVTEQTVNLVLTAIVAAMQASNNDSLRLVATTAMLNTLGFARSNFKNEAERNQIMATICANTQCQNPSVRFKAFECIVCVASLYYEFLSTSMLELYNITVKAIENDEQEVAIQAIEFWSTLCDEEIDIQYEIQEGIEPIGEERKLMSYVQAAVNPRVADMKSILDVLFGCIQKQEEDQEEDSWNIAMAAGTCLGLVAQCIRDQVVQRTIAFVTENLKKQGPEHWRQREAALLAFGSMLDGPDPMNLQNIVRDGLTHILLLLNEQNEPNVQVRDTAAWTVGVICQLHVRSLTREVFEPLMQVLIGRLDDKPQVARNVSYAIHYLANAFKGNAEDETNMLSPYFSGLVSKLIETTKRPDWAEYNLRGEAYEACIMLVESAALDQMNCMLQMLEHCLELLQKTIVVLQNGCDSETKQETDGLQTHLCGLLLVLLQRVDVCPQMNNDAYDRIMKIMLQILSNKNSPAQSDALLVTGVVASNSGTGFSRFMQQFYPIFEQGLLNRDEYHVCATTVGVIGDVVRVLEGQSAEFCSHVIDILLNNLRDEHLDRSVKPPTLAVFGDIALAIGYKFTPYVDKVMHMLGSAANTQINNNDEELVEYLNTLRESILESFSGILQGMNVQNPETNRNASEVLMQYYPTLLTLVNVIGMEDKSGKQQISPSVIKGAVGVLGDVACVLGQGPVSKIREQSDAFVHLIHECARYDESSKQLAQWAHNMCFNSN